MDSFLPPPEPLSPLRSSFDMDDEPERPTGLSTPSSSPPGSSGNNTTAPHNNPASTPVSAWTRHHVRDWLEDLGCGAYVRLFDENHIAGDILLEVDEAALQEIGVARVGDRIRLGLSLEAMRRAYAQAEVAALQQQRDLAAQQYAQQNAQHAQQIAQMAQLRLRHGSYAGSTLTPGGHQAAAPSPVESFFTPSTGESLLGGLKTEKQPPATFINYKGQCLQVNVSKYFDAGPVKKRVIKKFQQKGMALWEGEEKVRSDSVVMYVTDEQGSPRAIEGIELISYCQTQEYKERDRILVCVRGHSPTAIQLATARQIVRQQHKQQQMKQKQQIHPRSKLDGFRPKSQDISRNLQSLQEFFPEAGTQALRKTIRNSQMYTKRMSRLSRVSNRSSIAMYLHDSDGEEASPPVPVLEDYLPTGGSAEARAIAGTAGAIGVSASPSPSAVTSPFSLVLPTGKERPVSFMSTASASSSSSSSSVEEKTLPPVPATLVMMDTADIPESEEEFAKLFQREQSGPSKWIRGKEIGAGSFGKVYLGLNSITGELMAVKQVELPSSAKEQDQRRRALMVEALQREMSLLRDLEHPNIVQYLGSNCENNVLNVFLEYVPGGSVASKMRSRESGVFEEQEVRRVVRQILEGLKYLHSRSIIHRDIKGANVLMDDDGLVKISDFGISKKLEEEKTNARTSIQGSPFWMAPEVARQKPYTFKTDIWSLGCLIVEMFTGSHPFPHFMSLQALYNMAKETPILPAIPQGISASAQDFLAQAFEIDYNKRPTAAEMLEHPFVKGNF